MYALLGLLPTKVTALSPDYRISVATVFTESTRRIIDTSASLQIVNRAIRAKNGTTVEHLPSWVPDCADNIWKSLIVRPRTLFQTTGTGERLKTYPSELAVLSVDGYQWDVVEAGGTYDKVKYGRIDEWLKVLELFPDTYVTGESLAEVLWRTLVLLADDDHLHLAPNYFGNSARHWFTDVLTRALTTILYRTTT